MKKNSKKIDFAQKLYIQDFVDSFDTWTNKASIVPMKKSTIFSEIREKFFKKCSLT